VDVAARGLGKATSRSGERVLGVAALVAVVVSAILSLVVAPPDAVQGEVQRLMYVHVPAAWLAYLSFLVVFVSSVAYLRTRRIRWDRIAAASAEIGVLFTALAIALGALIYLAYLAVRGVVDNPSRRARWAAVIGIVGFVDVPIVHLSVTWWRSLHQGPTFFRLGGPEIHGSMLVALLVGVVAFTLVYAYLIALRLRVGRLEERAVREALSPEVGELEEADA
jgi:heme exporter protein C